jgi:outer membrane scaffolding protein for murein synthesis (MipA/OmpV family)
MHRSIKLTLALALSAAGSSMPAAADDQFEGAIGIVGGWGPAYLGASNQRSRFLPGMFVRYQRFSLATTSGFVTRRRQDEVRGMGVDLRDDDRIRISVGLRLDGGRSESASATLAGMGDVRNTVRARAAGTWLIDGRWRVGLSWSVDAFARGGGNFGDIGFSRTERLSPSTSWSWGAALTLGGESYMQTYFGVTEEQSRRTGYRRFEPGFGVRDIGAGIGMRSELTDRWVAFAGANVFRLLGDAAASPLTLRKSGYGVSGGVAWRF